MPIYEYECPEGHKREVFIGGPRPVPGTVQCEECGAKAQRVMSAASLSADGTYSYRSA